MYAAWIKIDDTLPWIELKGEYPTRRDAGKAAERTVKNIKIRTVKLPKKEESIKSLAVVKIQR
ncbi:hypothetical protein HXY32_05950 [Candidatus Bathyarchaeota archaeon]|nr:hypothetical protein [Candidatus Bathyarchaeota archaeon]